jgi:hypothetical protein
MSNNLYILLINFKEQDRKQEHGHKLYRPLQRQNSRNENSKANDPMHPIGNSRVEIANRKHHDGKEHFYLDTSQIERVFEL